MKNILFVITFAFIFLPFATHAQSIGQTFQSVDELVETPWSWYITRASGLVAFAFAWIVIFLGIAIRLPILKRFISPVYSLSIHHTLALQTIFFAALHGGAMLFDQFTPLGITDILIPFHTDTLDPLALSLGILAFYGLLIITLTSIFKPMIPHKIWRITHFLNVAVYVAIIAHALMLGTELTHSLFRTLFIIANIFLGILFLWNLVLKISETIRHPTYRFPNKKG